MNLHTCLKNKKALITGASSGIGAVTAVKLAQEGIHTIIVARRKDRLSELEEQINSGGGTCTSFQADLTIETERLRLFEYITSINLLPDILINNAGMGWYGYFTQMPWNVASDLIKLNIEACVHLTRLCLPYMVENKWGRIINIGSIAGQLPEQGIAVYSATKAFLDAFTTSIYRDLKGSGVTASTVRCGPVKTEFFDTARNLVNGGSVPAEKMSISSQYVANSIWRLIRRPQRVAYVPFYLAVSPLLEILFSGVVDMLGPLLLKRKKKITVAS